MHQLHLVVPVHDGLSESDLDRMLNAADDVFNAFGITTWGYHAHVDETPDEGGEIVGWLVTSTTQRDFASHSAASRYADRVGGELQPIYRDEVAV